MSKNDLYTGNLPQTLKKLARRQPNFQITCWTSSWIFELDFELEFRGRFLSWIFQWDFELDFRGGQCKMSWSS